MRTAENQIYLKMSVETIVASISSGDSSTIHSSGSESSLVSQIIDTSDYTHKLVASIRDKVCYHLNDRWQEAAIKMGYEPMYLNVSFSLKIFLLPTTFLM